MEQIVEQVLNADNVRMLVLIVVGYCGYLKLRGQTKGLGYSLNKRIDGVEASLSKRIDGVEASLNKRIDELKYNDFAHLTDTIKALTFTLEKNKFLEKEDREYIDGRLDR